MAYHVWPEMFMRAFFFRLALVSATSPSVTWQVQAAFAAPLLEEELRLSCPDSLTSNSAPSFQSRFGQI